MREQRNVKDFQTFITGDQQLLASSAGIVRNVNVTDLGMTTPAAAPGGAKGAQRGGGPGTRQRVALVMDGEQCLDRLYGGYFPNWVCGGCVQNY